MYKINFHKKVKNDLEGVGKKELTFVKKVIGNKLSKDPLLFGKQLQKSLNNYRSLRIGKYRIVYKIKSKEVYILVIGHRKDIYEKATKRID